MIDLTPLDVRKKRGDFAKGVRGYVVQEVDSFLELVAERLEELVKENLTLRERVDRLAEQVTAQTGRERAVHEALVTAQQLREEISASAQKEADLALKEARAQGREIIANAERRVTERADALHELERRRKRLLASFRHFLERELDAITVEENRTPLDEELAIELDLGGGRAVGVAPRAADDIHDLASDLDPEEAPEQVLPGPPHPPVSPSRERPAPEGPTPQDDLWNVNRPQEPGTGTSGS